MIKRILGTQFAGVASAAFLIGGFSLLGKVVGLARNSIFADKFGASAIMDIYYSAFLVPDFIYNLFVLGFLSAVFIPLFAHYFHENKEEAWHFANATLNVLFVGLAVVSVALFFLMPFILPFLISGLPEHIKLEAISVSRIMLLSPIFLGLSSIFGSIAQNFKKYVYFSLAPIFYNFGIIFGALVFAPRFGVYGLALGVILGALLHFSIQLYGAISIGFKYQAIFNFNHAGVLKMARLSMARFFSIAASQINFIILISLASFLGVGSITIFNFANDVQFLPIGLIGLSYAVAVFPKLSEMAAKKEEESFIYEFSEAFRQILFFVIPLGAFIFLLREEIVYLIYGGGFDAKESHMIAAVLGFFAISIFAQSGMPILNRAFYALQNTWIPFVTDFFSFLITIISGIIFVRVIDSHGIFYDFIVKIISGDNLSGVAVVGLPMAFSLGALFNFFITLYFLKKKVKELDIKDLFRGGLKLFIASFIMVAVIYLVRRLFLFYGGESAGVLITAIYILMFSILGAAIYLSALYFLKAKEYIFFKKTSRDMVGKILTLRTLGKELPESLE